MHALMPWTVVAIAMGVGLTGRGLPLPCLTQRSAHLTPHLARPPPPPPGAGQSWRYPVESRAPGLQSIGNTRMRSQQRY